MNSRMLPVRSAMSRSKGMVSLRPLFKFSRALGRQVFPVDGSGRTDAQDEGCLAGSPGLLGSRGQGRQGARGRGSVAPPETGPYLSPMELEVK